MEAGGVVDSWEEGMPWQWSMQMEHCRESRAHKWVGNRGNGLEREREGGEEI